jgi:hypothetical protein
MEREIINRVQQSELVEINLEDFYPKGERELLDIKKYLISFSLGEGQGEAFILKEKDFRNFVKNENWSKYQDKFVAIICSANAIIPTWAYMLVATALQPFAKRFVLGDMSTLESVLFIEALSKINPEKFRNKKLVIKGCGTLPVPESAYMGLVRILAPVAKSIMFGEPCSTVPIYKRK